jgi:hypothetical protein
MRRWLVSGVISDEEGRCRDHEEVVEVPWRWLAVLVARVSMWRRIRREFFMWYHPVISGVYPYRRRHRRSR